MVDGSQNFTPHARTKKLNQASSLGDIHTFLSELLAAFSPTSGLQRDYWVTVKLENSSQPQRLKTVNADNFARKQAENVHEKLFYSDAVSILEDVITWLRTGAYKSHEIVTNGLNQQEIKFSPEKEWGHDGSVPQNQVSENSLQKHHTELRQMIEALLDITDQLLKENTQTLILEPLFEAITQDPIKAWSGEEKNYSVHFFAETFSNTPEGSRFIVQQQNNEQISVLEIRKLCDFFTDRMSLTLVAMQSQSDLNERRKSLLNQRINQLESEKKQLYFGETKNIQPGRPGSKKGGSDQQRIEVFLSFFTQLIQAIQSDAELATLIKNFADDLIRRRIKQTVVAAIYDQHDFESLELAEAV